MNCHWPVWPSVDYWSACARREEVGLQPKEGLGEALSEGGTTDLEIAREGGRRVAVPQPAAQVGANGPRRQRTGRSRHVSNSVSLCAHKRAANRTC